MRVELAFDLAEVDESDEFVRHQPFAEKPADGSAIVPGNSQQPCYGSEDESEELLHRAGDPACEAVRPSKESVGERDQREERNQHCADVEAELQAIARALRRGIDDVH